MICGKLVISKGTIWSHTLNALNAYIDRVVEYDGTRVRTGTCMLSCGHNNDIPLLSHPTVRLQQKVPEFLAT